jgi:hypothetical protein
MVERKMMVVLPGAGSSGGNRRTTKCCYVLGAVLRSVLSISRYTVVSEVPGFPPRSKDQGTKGVLMGLKLQLLVLRSTIYRGFSCSFPSLGQEGGLLTFQIMVRR